MRADAFLDAVAEAPLVDLDALAGGRGLVVLAPHPDDESLGCGGLIAEAVARERAVRLLVLTDGAASHPLSEALTGAMLRDIREAETLAAAAALGLAPDHVAFLRLPDAAAPSTGPEADRVVRAIREAVRDCDAGAVVTTWRHDPHCDHETAAFILDRAMPLAGGARAFAFTVWGRALPPQTEVGVPREAVRLDVSAHRDAKRRAVLAHVSQTVGLPGEHAAGFRLDPAMIDRLCGPSEAYWEHAP